jgi:hypothetical protein
MLLNINHHIEITGRTALQTGLSFSGKLEAAAALDSGRDFQGKVLFALNPAVASAISAGLIDDLTSAITFGTGAGQRKVALLITHLTGPATDSTSTGAGARFGAGASARVAGLVAGNLNLGFETKSRILEFDAQIIA